MKYPYGTVHYLTDSLTLLALAADFSVRDFVIYSHPVDVKNLCYRGDLDTDRLFTPNYFGKVDQPIRVRHVCLKFIYDYDLPSGYKSNSIVRVPILKRSFYDVIKVGDLGVYAGRGVRVIAKVPEKLFVSELSLVGLDL